MSQEDLELKCVECSNTFIFTAGEQEFFKKKGFTSQPKKCPDCRAKRKAHGVQRPFKSKNEQRHFQAICSRCEKSFDAPFEPKPGRAIFCRDCFQSQKS